MNAKKLSKLIKAEIRAGNKVTLNRSLAVILKKPATQKLHDKVRGIILKTDEFIESPLHGYGSYPGIIKNPNYVKPKIEWLSWNWLSTKVIGSILGLLVAGVAALIIGKLQCQSTHPNQTPNTEQKIVDSAKHNKEKILQTK